MTELKMETKTHPTEAELAGYLENSLNPAERSRVEGHIAGCRACLDAIVAAYESVREFNKKGHKKGVKNIMKKIILYPVFAAIFFALSFAVPRYFIQFLAAALLLGIKWIVDAKSTRMLVMIYEAWKKGGEKEASRILEQLDEKKPRF